MGRTEHQRCWSVTWPAEARQTQRSTWSNSNRPPSGAASHVPAGRPLALPRSLDRLQTAAQPSGAYMFAACPPDGASVHATRQPPPPLLLRVVRTFRHYVSILSCGLLQCPSYGLPMAFLWPSASSSAFFLCRRKSILPLFCRSVACAATQNAAAEQRQNGRITVYNWVLHKCLYGILAAPVIVEG